MLRNKPSLPGRVLSLFVLVVLLAGVGASLLRERGEANFEVQPAHNATLEDLDDNLIQKYAAAFLGEPVPNRKQAILDLLPRRGCLVKEDGVWRPTISGYLLFGKEPQLWLPSAEILLARYTGKQMSDEFLRETARAVADPGGGTLYEAWRRGQDKASGAEPDVTTRLGSGSDYTVFLNHLGIPVADLSFDGPYGVYHSIYDNHNWVSRIGDPGFRYHLALVQLWGVIALRLANADSVPLDYEPYAARIAEFLKQIERRWPAKDRDVFGTIRLAIDELRLDRPAFEARPA